MRHGCSYASPGRGPAGRTYGTVLAYRNGVRKAPPEVLEKLAAFMRKHSVELADAADELEGGA